jgi:hypothetical protein
VYYALVPLVIVYQMWGMVVLGVLVSIASTVYHLHDEKKYKYTDYFFANMALVATVWVLVTGNHVVPFLITSIAMLGIAMFFYVREFQHEYDVNHAAWHVFSALFTFFAILAYNGGIGL